MALAKDASIGITYKKSQSIERTKRLFFEFLNNRGMKLIYEAG
jgi:hypothetical protein